jgi:hypothetical protein
MWTLAKRKVAKMASLQNKVLYLEADLAKKLGLCPRGRKQLFTYDFR